MRLPNAAVLSPRPITIEECKEAIKLAFPATTNSDIIKRSL